MEGIMEETNDNKHITKSKFATAIVMMVIFVAFTIFAFVYYFGEPYTDFYKTARQEFEIVGLSDNLVPQSLCYFKDDANNIFLVGGYMSDGKASRVYVVDAKTYVTLKSFSLAYLDENDNIVDYVGHCGGIKTDGNGVWFCGESYVYYFKYEDIIYVDDGGQIVADSYFNAPNGADFLTIYDNKLLVGEFHKDGKYDTSESHVIETTNGTNHAVTFAYEIDNNSEYGLRNLNPVYAISTTSLVQGMAITDDSIILSTSYSLPSSNLYVYKNVLNSGLEPIKMTFENVEEEVDTYILDTPAKTIKAPCMSEEIAVKDDRLFILFENACNKYKYFTRDNFKTAYSIELPTIE